MEKVQESSAKEPRPRPCPSDAVQPGREEAERSAGQEVLQEGKPQGAGVWESDADLPCMPALCPELHPRPAFQRVSIAPSDRRGPAKEDNAFPTPV